LIYVLLIFAAWTFPIAIFEGMILLVLGLMTQGSETLISMRRPFFMLVKTCLGWIGFEW
jgi:predicted small integral membrane protein